MKVQKQTPQPDPQISWENIFTSLEDAVIVTDLRGKIFLFNQAAEALTDFSAPQVLDQPASFLFHRNQWIMERIKSCQPPFQGSTRGEGIFITRRGRQVPVSLTLSPLQDRQGAALGSIVLLRDLTHRKELEEDLKRSDRMAMLGTLAVGLAHEIKNPLGGIKGAAQLLKRSFAGDVSAAEYTEIVVREADRVNQLIEQLLDLSRPVQLELGPVNIHEILDEVLMLEGQTVPGGEVAVKKNFDPSLPPILGDRNQLTQVFLNIVKNALQAMKGRGVLTVTTRVETDFHIREEGKKRGNFISVDIKDDGPGIADEILPHIFSPFFTTKNKGTGLGLAVCYRIIKEHGGLIRVESSGYHGTVFKISLRVADY